eukprot:scaffold244677_cov19-Tisochrysis_lutea.AAC.1
MHIHPKNEANLATRGAIRKMSFNPRQFQTTLKTCQALFSSMINNRLEHVPCVFLDRNCGFYVTIGANRNNPRFASVCGF